MVFLADLYELALDELVGRITFDKYARIKEYLKEFAAEDIPTDDEDDSSAIVTRYLLFVKRMGLTEEQSLEGLQEIFLHGVEVG